VNKYPAESDSLFFQSAMKRRHDAQWAKGRDGLEDDVIDVVGLTEERPLIPVATPTATPATTPAATPTAPPKWTGPVLGIKTQLPRKYVCDQCGSAYGRRCHLWTHKLIHSGVRRFGCGLCSKTFVQATNAEAHQRTHTGEKPYTCGVCGTRFSQIGTLNRHVYTHADRKPYGCGSCALRFTQSSSAKRHAQKCTASILFVGGATM
jgi:uncharacterized Zn-finger protein